MADDNYTEPLSHERRRYDEALAAKQRPDPDAVAAEEATRLRHLALWNEAMDRWVLFETGPEADQRRQEAEDLRFDRARLEDHWPEDQRVARGASTITSGGVQINVSARPMLVISKLAQPVAQIVNEGLRARLAPTVKAKPGKANDEDAEVAQGLLRALEQNGNSAPARGWGWTRAVKCGRGYWRVETVFANDGDFELDIVTGRIKNQGSVYIDPFHTEPDASDMEFAFITEDLPTAVFKRKHGDLVDAGEITKHTGADGFTSTTDKPQSWVSKDTIRVAEYFYVVVTDRWLVEGAADIPEAFEADFDLDDKGTVATEPDPATLPPLEDGSPRRVRKVQHRQVKWALLAPGKVLAESDWPGRYIPIVQVIGREFNVDGASSYKGAITDSKDAQRVYNYAVSAEVESVALAPRAPWVAAYGQLEKYRNIWQQANLRNFAWLPYDPVSVQNTLVGPPQRQSIEPAIGAIATLVNQADSDIKATTGRWDPSLGSMDPSARSGKALDRLQQQGELGSSDMVANFATSVRHECRIILDLAQYVYVEPGRVMTMLGDEPGNESQVMLNQEFIRGEDGAPEAVQPGARGLYQKMRHMGRNKGVPPKVERYDIARIANGSNVVVDVAPSHKTQRDENLAILQSMIEADPNLAAMIGDIMAEEVGGPMGRKLSERIRSLNPKLQTPEGAEGLPEEAKAALAAKDAQIQEMGAALQQMQQAVQTNQAKQQAQVQVAQIKAQGDMAVARARLDADASSSRMKLEAEIQAEIAKLSAEAGHDAKLEEFKAAMKKALQDDEQRHDILMRTLDAEIAAESMARQERTEEAREFRGASREQAAEARADRRTADERAFTQQESAAERAVRLAAAKKPGVKK